MNWKSLALGAAFISVLTLSFASVADAARFGGGRSFGRTPSVSRPVAPSSPMQRQAIPNQGVGGAAAAARPGFGFGGGMLGGLLAGSMIGSLFGGSSNASAAGAEGSGSTGPGLLDIVLIGGVAYLGYRMLSRRRASPAGYQQQNTARGGSNPGGAWENLSSRPASFQSQGEQAAHAPAGFDSEEFLRGAKMAYVRLQESWDKRDLNDIAQFTGPDVLEELKRQAAEDPNPSHTELLLVNAELMDVSRSGSEEVATVLFDVLMQEHSMKQEPQQVREIWVFAKEGSASWRLDGIQQV